ncbi:MAG: tRNA-guanine transglycosylase [Thermanaerothrix sp.]|uniref:tRNA-guanine transglycosylase n=1 Tax=Thermanaerothrix sp. TaxID=2972675 RepID=UPI003C7AC258
MGQITLYPVVSFITGTTPNGGGLWKYILRGPHGLLRSNRPVMTQVLHFLDFKISPATLARWRTKPIHAHYNGHFGLNYTGDLFVDSGGFTLLTDPNLDLSEYGIPSSHLAEHITQLQLDLGSTYLVSLDYPIPPNLSADDALERQRKTLHNALIAARYLQALGDRKSKLYVPVHGRNPQDIKQFTQNVFDAFEREGLLNQIYGVALGSMVPLRKAGMESSILEFCRAVRSVIPDALPLHVFGVTGSLMPFLVASGATSFDASGYVQNARVLHYLHPETRRLIPFRKLQNYPCQCRVCRERDFQADLKTLDGEDLGLQKSEVYAAIALHNLGVEDALVAEINQSLQTGRLEQLLEELPRRYPKLRWPGEERTNAKTVPLVRMHSPDDFDLRRENWTPAPKPIVLFLPCSQEKPYTRSRSYRAVKRALDHYIPNWEAYIQIVFLSGLYGPVPIEMVNHPNVLDYDFKLHLKDETGKMRGRERVLAFLERYQLTFSRFVGYVTQPAYRDVLSHTGIVLLPKQPGKRQNHPEALKELIAWIREQMDH